MKPFEVGRKSIEFWTIAGEVLDTQKHSKTHVSSSGGGGVLNQGTGYVSAPTVTSITTTRHEFWLRTDQGEEVAVTLSGDHIPMRPGQQVSLLCAKNKKKDDGYYCTLINHNARRHWTIKEPKDLLQQFGWLGKAKPTLFATGVSLYLLVITKFWIALATGVGLYAAFSSLSHRRQIAKFSEHIEELVQSTYESVVLPPSQGQVSPP